MVKKGIDISKYQKDIDWQKVKKRWNRICYY